MTKEKLTTKEIIKKVYKLKEENKAAFEAIGKLISALEKGKRN